MKRARRSLSPTEQIHADWLGMLQPEGLVVSIPVLVEAEAWGRQGPEVQARLRGLAPEGTLSREAFGRLLVEVLGWSPGRLRGDEGAGAWRVPMEDLGLELAPDQVLVDRAGQAAVLIRWSGGEAGAGRRLAQDQPEPGSRFPLSRQSAFERLLAELQREGGGTAIGVHAGPEAIRLCYAPRGEAPGALTFPVEAMLTRDGRILLDALVMLLGQDRLWNVPAERRLGVLLAASRRRQEEVTGALAGQVREALRILADGFNVADQRARGRLLADWRGAGDAAEEARLRAALREGFTSVILRLVFLLYCEDARDSAGRAILPVDNALYRDGYSLGALAERLAEDRARYQEAMSSRFGAWARICALFRLIFNGVQHPDLSLPARQGELFDPGRFPFLEGRAMAGSWTTEQAEVPAIDDGVVDGVLENLVFLEGQRVSYRNLDVEQLGSVYEALMELDLRRADTELLHESGVVRAGALYLEAGAERRNTGSHYTPPALTGPIVERALGPLLGAAPGSEQILALKICDPAMGSGAFLAEACRYLGRRLLEAWRREGRAPAEADTDPLLAARRRVAERCLYGVDKNPFAVNLARLSMWLVTLARDQPFTFVDHALTCGDAVIGLNMRQIQALSLEDRGNVQLSFATLRVAQNAARAREKIHSPDLFSWRQKHTLLQSARDDVAMERQIGDALLACAWLGGTAKQQKERLARLKDDIQRWQASLKELPPQQITDLLAALPMRPFHWDLEFPEVFLRPDGTGGFDAVIGNPPFGGQETIRQANGGAQYIKLLQALHPHAHGNSDLCAHFFLRAAAILRKNGCFGLVATNTIKQGDTRETGLKHLIEHRDITFYDAVLNQPWVGGAAVYVDVVHGRKGPSPTGKKLNSMLQEEEEQAEPVELKEREGQAFMGAKVYGQGFVLTPDEAAALIAGDRRNAEIIRPYIGGEELNSNLPGDHGFILHDRYVIDFGDRSLEEAERWLELIQIVREKVKPERDLNNRDIYKINWWKFAESRPGMRKALSKLDATSQLPPPGNGVQIALFQCLVTSRVSKHHIVAFQSTKVICSEQLIVFALYDYTSFAILQSFTHETWVRSLGSTMGTTTRYTPTTCFETFPFPRPTATQQARMEATGEAFHLTRAQMQRERGLGLTKLWNLAVDPANTDGDIQMLRALKADMDQAVLDAYGWSDIAAGDSREIIRRLRALNAARAKGR